MKPDPLDVLLVLYGGFLLVFLVMQILLSDRVAVPMGVRSTFRPGDTMRRRDARKLLLTYYTQYLSYHGRKETMCWLLASTLVGGSLYTSTVVRPALAKLSTARFELFCLLLATTDVLGLWLLWWQYRNRRAGAAMSDACSNVLSRWSAVKPTPEDLRLTVRSESYKDGDRMIVPAALAQEYRRILDASPIGKEPRVTVAIVFLWVVGTFMLLISGRV